MKIGSIYDAYRTLLKQPYANIRDDEIESEFIEQI